MKSKFILSLNYIQGYLQTVSPHFKFALTQFDKRDTRNLHTDNEGGRGENKTRSNISLYTAMPQLHQRKAYCLRYFQSILPENNALLKEEYWGNRVGIL